MTAAIAFPPLPSGASRVALSSIALLEVSGVDAGAFLHGQLSSDVKALAVGVAQFASYNSPKGRMLANLIVWRRADEDFALILAADLADAIKKRMSMFVLRAKAAIAATPRHLCGVLGHDAARAIATTVGPPLVTWASATAGDAMALHLPDGRYLLDVGDELPAPIAELSVVDEALWQWCGIRAGVPVITAATSDKLIAQSANWELLGGVDFRKGCYPGQEIIARMQYLGRLKERLHAFHADIAATAIGAGTPVRAAGRDEAVGGVVNSAPSPGGGSDLLAVVQNDAVNGEALFAGDSALAMRALPYAVPLLENARVRL